MKKTKKKNVFQKFANFIDKKVVVPITRLIVAIGKGLGRSE